MKTVRKVRTESVGSASVADLAEHGILSPLDRHFAASAVRVAGEERPQVELAAALASRAVGQGHVCLDLERLVAAGGLRDEAGEAVPVAWPNLDEWRASLLDSCLVARAADTVAPAVPLVMDRGGRLYLRRYWEYQRRLAAALLERAERRGSLIDADRDGGSFARLFADSEAEPCDWQRVAAAAALLQRLCIVSGGPGTGKTFTVVKILALLIEQALAAGNRVPRIELLAPTGKAAARLAEAVRTALPSLDCDDRVRSAIPDRAATLHRALGSRRGRSSGFARDAANPLLADIILVDEASMIDLAMMAHLVDAVPPRATLILLGDKDQLASVEAGAVLGDICHDGRENSYSAGFAARVESLSGDELPIEPGGGGGIRDCIVQLTRSYRYNDDSGIGMLARAINDGDADTALAVLASPRQPEVRLRDPIAMGALGGALGEAVRRHFAPTLAAPAETALAALSSFRVLCALRRGPFGVEGMNRRIEDLLRAGRLIANEGELYQGRPIMVTRNDYHLSLFNGDVGVLTEDRGGRPWALFAAPEGGWRRVAATHLPEHETVFAATVHKSQGSEFDEIAVVLPDRDAPILSRELLYTAVTRARRAVTLYASAEIVAAAIGRRVERASGLRGLLWGAEAPDRGPGQLNFPF
jgi:exodeoxyribonuclease V alpha subunit